MQKLQLELPVLLPDIPHEKDQCVDRLIDRLQDESGIDRAHLEGKDPARLCLHYDPELISLQKVKSIAKQSGAGLTRRFRHSLLDVKGIRHARHARRIERDLLDREGILEAVASVAGSLRLEWDSQLISEADIQNAVQQSGLTLVEDAGTVPSEAHDHDHDHDHDHGHDHDEQEHGGGHDHQHGGFLGEYTELYFAIGSGVFWLAGLLLSLTGFGAEWVTTALFIIALILGGYFTLLEAIATIRQGKFEIDFLMLVAAAGAAALGKWEEAALLLFLFSLGHALENYAMNRARKSITALAELAPPTALLKRQDELEEVAVEQLAVGDIIVVKPNSKIAADGVVIKGNSAVNQAPITGESVPVNKYAVSDPNQEQDLQTLPAEHRAFAGTINGSNVLEIKVLKPARDSTLSRLVTMVKEAETQKSPTQHLTDKFERYFVPAVLVLVALLHFAFLVIDEPFSASFYRAMAVLVAASPCALAISTPSAVLAGVARAARQGVLIKGGRPLEDLGSLNAVAFDKTGTLTEGKPKLTKVVPQKGVSEEELLRVAVPVEQLSDHPLAAAIVEGGEAILQDDALPKAQGLEALTARGIKAQLAGKTVHIGNRRLFRELTGEAIPSDIDRTMSELEAGGNTAMIVHEDGRYLGVISVMDVARPEAKTTLQKLKERGIRRMIMLTGDHQKVADAVGKELGITDPMGSLLPEDKVAAIEKLKQEEGQVAMVGDGVNDAPAMARSTVGIAMGAAGSDVALETADIALMADKLDNLPFAIGLSRKAKGIIKQNLWISLGMVAILVPLTLLGVAEIGPAVIAHEGSTLVVVGNALRLLAYKSK
ncbi:heavy metal translocating P-type ATPase [Flavilitoribacter nigricans]|uniref:P-type Zn(2+) transporter n=1 Tax=Flavilitoribacter nigricans (strain ATCC 23147 / DSM 23189 / NBRC 102662 / NCIMB 1420 / SS-2) TaxID=1122177 RepID=A0A2D0N9T2_FLAN2|nr:heavy metal translocating P-type ATPase [Flavilitoribacter nigricans]PHN05237.1 heavy metal translocating P-type ATPase [Flavilitoribacter nigricans DSM 23189 = NBRC 102662]